MSYIAVDLDGCLAEYSGWNNGEIGKPIPLMVQRVKNWLANGKRVMIFTARVALDPSCYSAESDRHADSEFVAWQHELIEDWCLEHLGQVLPVTAIKSPSFTEFWDDRCVPVQPNKGIDIMAKLKAALILADQWLLWHRDDCAIYHRISDDRFGDCTCGLVEMRNLVDDLVGEHRLCVDAIDWEEMDKD